MEERYKEVLELLEDKGEEDIYILVVVNPKDVENGWMFSNAPPETSGEMLRHTAIQVLGAGEYPPQTEEEIYQLHKAVSVATLGERNYLLLSAGDQDENSHLDVATSNVEMKEAIKQARRLLDELEKGIQEKPRLRFMQGTAYGEA